MEPLYYAAAFSQVCKMLNVVHDSTKVEHSSWS